MINLKNYDLEVASCAEINLIGSIFLFPEFMETIKKQRMIIPEEFSDYAERGRGDRARIFQAQWDSPHADMVSTLNELVQSEKRKDHDIAFINNSITAIESSPMDYPHYCRVIREQHMALNPHFYTLHPDLLKQNNNNLKTVEL